MGIQNNTLLIPRKNTAAVVAFTFAKIGTADFEVTTCGAGEQILGIFTDTQATAARDVPIAIAGVGSLTLGGTVTRGAKLKSDASGYGVTSSTDTEEYGAIALQSGVSGDVIEVLIAPASTLAG